MQHVVHAEMWQSHGSLGCFGLNGFLINAGGKDSAISGGRIIGNG
jgi:hypothetical protein